jgi:hypothetical protein
LPGSEDKGGSGIALYAFDRESFMADPHEFVKGIEEDLMLPAALPGKFRPPYLPPYLGVSPFADRTKIYPLFRTAWISHPTRCT